MSSDVCDIIFYLYCQLKKNIYIRFKVFTAVAMKNVVFGMLRRVALVRTDVSEEPSFIRVTRIGELGTTLAVTSNRRTHQSLRISSQRASVASYS
jgi:hypothetical protein